MTRHRLRIATVVGAPAARDWIRALLSDLEPIPQAVLEFESAEACLSAIARDPIDVVLLGDGVGEVTAREFFECLTSRGVSSPVIALIDETNETQRNALFAAGAVESLSRSKATPSDLRRALDRAVEWSVLRDAFRASHEPEQPNSSTPAFSQEQLHEFLHSLFHELKTPLTAVHELVSILREEIPGGLNDQQRELLGLCGASCDQLREIMDDTIDRHPHGLPALDAPESRETTARLSH